MPLKLVVLSDIHLMAEAHAQHDLGNHDRLRTAIARINSAYSDADLVAFAGDLVDRGGERSSYVDLKDMLADLNCPWAVTLGNHDDRDVFFDVFGPDWDDGNGFVQSAHDVGGYRVILLDSLEKDPDPDAPHFTGPNGHLCETRLAWLAARLDEAKDRPVIVIQHHPAWPVSIKMDAAGMIDPEPLTDLLRAHGDVRQVIGGHIHMTTTVIRGGIAWTTIAGNYSTSAEDFGHKENKIRREGPAQMAVVLGTEQQTTVHFDNIVDHHALVVRSKPQ